MKKLALTAAIVALSVPAVAHAGNMQNKHNTNYEASTTYVTEMVTVGERTDIRVVEGPQTLDLVDTNQRLYINGDKIQLVDTDGHRYFAPDGGYTTTAGVTYYSNDGRVGLIEAPQDVIYIELDDDNNNGVIDDVDIEVDSTNTVRAYN